MIVDLSLDGDEMINQNVLVEFGIACALKPRKIYPISRGDVAEKLPWDLKGLHVKPYNTRNELYGVVTTAMCALGGYYNAAAEGDEALKARIFQLFKRNTQLSRGEIAERIGVADLSRVSKLINSLVGVGQLDYGGEKRGRYYFGSVSP